GPDGAISCETEREASGSHNLLHRGKAGYGNRRGPVCGIAIGDAEFAATIESPGPDRIVGTTGKRLAGSTLRAYPLDPRQAKNLRWCLPTIKVPVSKLATVIRTPGQHRALVCARVRKAHASRNVGDGDSRATAQTRNSD